METTTTIKNGRKDNSRTRHDGEAEAYVLAHMDRRPRTLLAREAGISLSTVYRLLRAHGAELRHELSVKRDGVERAISELYPTRTASEIAAETGLSTSTVKRWARRLGLAHDPETLERIDEEKRARLAMNRTPESRARQSATYRRRRKADYLRFLSGQPLETRFRFRVVPEKTRKAMWHLERTRDYFRVEGEPYTLCYDEQTRRLTGSRDEAYYASRYGIRFLPADPEEGEEVSEP